MVILYDRSFSKPQDIYNPGDHQQCCCNEAKWWHCINHHSFFVHKIYNPCDHQQCSCDVPNGEIVSLLLFSLQNKYKPGDHQQRCCNAAILWWRMYHHFYFSPQKKSSRCSLTILLYCSKMVTLYHHSFLSPQDKQSGYWPSMLLYNVAKWPHCIIAPFSVCATCNGVGDTLFLSMALLA